MKFHVIFFLLIVSSQVWSFHPNESVYKSIWSEGPQYYRETKESLIQWDDVVEDVWSNFHLWKSARALQDIRDKRDYTAQYIDKKEIMGKILDCYGDCWANRGLEKTPGQYMTTLVEGDEVYTTDKSYAWIFLLDGTLIRLSPQTSLHLIEMNISKERIIIVARLGRGHIQWFKRSPEKLFVLPTPDSDPVFLPLKMVEANREYIYREGPREMMSDFFDVVNRQYEELNLAIKKNNEWIVKGRKVEHYLVLSNVSLTMNDASVEAYYPELAGKSYVRQLAPGRSFRREAPIGQVSLSFRGYENVPEDVNLVVNDWFEIDAKGEKSTRLAKGPKGSEDWAELITTLPTFWLAREILLHRLSKVFFDLETPREILEKTYGHRLWEQGWQERKEYIKNQMTRQETANIGLVEILKEKGGWWAEAPVDGKILNKEAVEANLNFQPPNQEELDFMAKKNAGEFYYWVLSKKRHKQ